MKPNMPWLLPIGFIALVLVTASALRSASQQPLNIHLTRAAIATMQRMQMRSTVVPKPTPQAHLVANSDSTKHQANIHPDKPLTTTLDHRFSMTNALNRINQIDQALVSFRELTQKSQASLEPQAIGNTDAETQTIGFPNWIGAVEGTLRQQEQRIKSLEYALAKKQYEDGEISQAVLAQKAAAHQQANQEFQTFLNSFGIVD